MLRIAALSRVRSGPHRLLLLPLDTGGRLRVVNSFLSFFWLASLRPLLCLVLRNILLFRCKSRSVNLRRRRPVTHCFLSCRSLLILFRSNRVVFLLVVRIVLIRLPVECYGVFRASVFGRVRKVLRLVACRCVRLILTSAYRLLLRMKRLVSVGNRR